VRDEKRRRGEGEEKEWRRRGEELNIIP